MTHDGQQKADINFKITTGHIQKVIPAKAITKGARGLGQTTPGLLIIQVYNVMLDAMGTLNSFLSLAN